MEIRETLSSTTGSNYVNEFELLKILGSGSFGTVYQAKDGDKYYALKVISKSKLRKIAMTNNMGRNGLRGGRLAASRGRVALSPSSSIIASPQFPTSGLSTMSTPTSFNKLPVNTNNSSTASISTTSSNASSHIHNTSLATNNLASKETSAPNSAVNSNPHSFEKPSPIDLVRKEIAIFKKLNHPNIVKLYQVINDDTNDCLYMVYEFCSKGTAMKVIMNDVVTPLTEDQSRNYFRQLLLGVEYLHSNGIAHRDIKPENILLSSDNVLKIVDLGESELFKGANDKSSKSVGSPAFFAPELCIPHHGEISTFLLDIFAMGVTLYCFLHGHLPFQGNSVLDLYKSIREDEPRFSNEISDSAKDLLRKLLEKNPEKRISIDDIRSHPWITNNDKHPLISKDQNTKYLVKEVTAEEISNAYKNISTVFNVLKAISKLKVKASLNKNALSASSGNTVATNSTASSMNNIQSCGFTSEKSLDLLKEDGGTGEEFTHTGTSNSVHEFIKEMGDERE